MKYAALLRGIGPMNPNMRNEKLREVFEYLGFSDIKTVISSGNVLFETPNTDERALASMIEEALPAHLGFKSTVILRNEEQLRRLVADNPFEGYHHDSKTYLTVTFLKESASAEVFQWPKDAPYCLVTMSDREICVVTDTTSAKTPDVMAQLERKFGKEITTRTWKTVERVLNRME